MTHVDPVRISSGKTVQSILASARANEEPVFVIRAKDLFSLPMLYHYLEQVEKYGPLNEEFNRTLKDLIEEFRAWQQANQGKVRYPD